MSKLALTYITMNAGDGVPGSILKHCLSTMHKEVDYCVVVDGQLTDQAMEFYKTIPNLKVVNSPWTGRHVDQYYARNSEIPIDDWVLCMDDDEYPSDILFNVGRHLATHPEVEVDIVYCPSLTYLATDSSNNFWRVQEEPNQEDSLRRSKRLLYKRRPNNYFIASPCGKHVTPTHIKDNRISEKPTWHHSYKFFHMKTIESFVFNECVYTIANPDHESGPDARNLTQEQEDTLVKLVSKYKLQENFLELTVTRSWPDEFRDFVYQFKDRLGETMSKFYYLYEHVAKKDFSNTRQLITCVSRGFTPVYDAVMSSNEAPIVIPRTPSLWQ